MAKSWDLLKLAHFRTHLLVLTPGGYWSTYSCRQAGGTLPTRMHSCFHTRTHRNMLRSFRFTEILYQFSHIHEKVHADAECLKIFLWSIQGTNVKQSNKFTFKYKSIVCTFAVLLPCWRSKIWSQYSRVSIYNLDKRVNVSLHQSQHLPDPIPSISSPFQG